MAPIAPHLAWHDITRATYPEISSPSRHGESLSCLVSCICACLYSTSAVTVPNLLVQAAGSTAIWKNPTAAMMRLKFDPVPLSASIGVKTRRYPEAAVPGREQDTEAVSTLFSTTSNGKFGTWSTRKLQGVRERQVLPHNTPASSQRPCTGESL